MTAGRTARYVLAAALSLALGLTTGVVSTAAAELRPGGTFLDDDGTPEEGYIEAIAAAGITRGCNPPANDRFCPDRTLTRAEMATILTRALHLETSPVDHFTDDDTSVHHTSINAIAAAGITRGCGSERFCPTAPLPRREMAVFVGRALDLTPQVPPERPPPPYPDVGDGKRIIYSNADQRVWLVEANGELFDTYLVSGRQGVPAPGTYEIFSKSPLAWATYGGITMEHMARFAHGIRLSYGFHAIPRWPNGEPLQTEEELGEYRSAGCVRQADDKAEALYNWAPIGTTVIVLP